MCTTCGCGHDTTVTIDGAAAHHHHHGPLGATHAAGTTPARVVQIEQDILAKNDATAARIRAELATAGVLALNLVSSPGSGKTTLLAKTLSGAAPWPAAVIEGDQQTDLDAARIRATGVKAVQINTGKGCHLNADMVAGAIGKLAPESGSVVFIENVGNLVCPAGFDLGEAAKVVILSVTEGDDKPLKYPDMFRAASLMTLNKSDLLAHVPFDVDACIANARRINPAIEVLILSAHTGDGLAAWQNWVTRRLAEQSQPVAV